MKKKIQTHVFEAYFLCVYINIYTSRPTRALANINFFIINFEKLPCRQHLKLNEYLHHHY